MLNLRPFSFSECPAGLVERVGHSGDELQTVLLVTKCRIVQVVVEEVHTQREAMIDGKREAAGPDRRPSFGIVTGLDVGSALGEKDLSGKDTFVGFSEG